MKLDRLILAILAFFQHPVLADIVTDGTVGPAQSISAIDGQLTIGQELGSLKGGNLFHSFQQFDIETNETATFTGDDATQNVISRVTGGNKSHINGILGSEVGSADFLFINPAGVVFDNNAQVDVPASFHVSTAGELIFADGSSFSAINPEASTLTVATPEAFGFTPEQNGSLKIIGGQLRFKPGTDVSLSANDLDIQQDANITVERIAGLGEQAGIHLNLTAIDSATTQAIPVAGLTNTQATGGELSIENSRIDISGNGAGRLAIRAGPMTVTGSTDDLFSSGLFAKNFGAQDVRETDGISIHVDALDLADASISSSALSDGDGGRIEIKAEQLKISGLRGISQEVLTSSPGKITVTVSGAMHIKNNGRISTTKAGIIDVTAGQLTVNGQGSQISSDAIDEGNAGKVTVDAEQLTIVGTSEKNFTGISTRASGKSNSDAGLIKIEVANTIQLLSHGQINTSSVDGDGGDISVESGEWIQLKDATITTSVSDSSIEKAGNILIQVPVLIMDTAEILAVANSEVLESREGKIFISENLLVPSENKIDSNRNPNSKNIIAGERSGQIFNTSQSIVGALAGFPPPNLETERLSQDPCAHRDENSLKKIGHGGAPAFQHGENYLPINRFDESEREPEDMDTLQIMPSINTDHKNSATECNKSRHTSLY